MFEFLTGPLLLTLFLGLLALYFLYRYSTRNFDYWEKRGLPYVKGIPFFGSAYELLWKPNHELELDRYVKYGALYGHFEGSRPLISVGDPNLIREVLVKEFFSFSNRRLVESGNSVMDSMLPNLKGEDWKRVRSIVSPTFTTGKIRRMMSIVKQCCHTLLQNLQKVSDKGKPYKVKELYGAFSMDVIASSAFSTKLDSHNDPKNQFVQTAKKAFSTSFSIRIAFHQLMPNLMKFLGIPVFLPQPTEFFKQVTLRIMEERKRTGQTRNDFLQLLMDTAKEVSQEQKWEFVSDKEDITSNYEQVESNQQAIKTFGNKSLSLDELVGNCVIFFLAAYDTSATTLTFASYLLALNPDIQDKAFEEIREVLQRYKGELTYEALQEMKYLDNIISETLRLYPPATRLERLTDVDTKLGDTGITIPKGMIISIPSYALHKDPQYFPDPEKFDPDRFTPEERAKRNPYAYLPFGAGPRNCVGMRFALMEVKVCLVYVITNFEMQRCPETKVPLEFHLGPGLLIPKSLVLKLKDRKERLTVK
ncbi:cytochrome P450 3A21-like [Argiope bruennichi]|uniref:cytochrome P450 3A21-like n=1 Tax=Argiope bruennichi TaxID=94029 RepID=UPI0024946011|nr:cytochrome P450 3A21-like [Argiope bruennichi]